MQLAFRWPYQRRVYKSPLAVSEARAALSQEMADVPSFRSAGGKALRGRMRGNFFRCSRVSEFRNLLLPVVTGQVRAVDGGSQIDLVLRLPWPSAAFLSVWTFGIMAILVGGTFAGKGAAMGARFWLLAVPLLGAGIAIAGFSFGSEALEVERIFKRCLRVSER